MNEGVAMQANLSRKVLKDVSRSFYLSLRFLPEGFRTPTSLGYLLARASDTIADAGELSIEDSGLLPRGRLGIWIDLKGRVW